jgi:molybdate transport system substrate-binding protein
MPAPRRWGWSVVLAAAVLGAAAAQAAELTVLGTTGIKSLVEELGPQFERSTGHKLALTFASAAVLKRQIDDGETFDLAILTADVADDLIKRGKLVAATRTDVARSGLGIAVRAGARKPDISSVDALKRALLDASSITYAKQAETGIYFAGLLERLGIADAMRPKTRFGGGYVAEVVVAGEADMAVQLVTELLAVRGVALVGPLPAEVQSYVVLTGVVGAQAKDAALAREFLQFLTAPAVRPVYRSKGLEPGPSF